MHFNQKFAHCPACGSANFGSNNVKSKRCANCNFVYYHNPSAAVAAFIFNEQHELLVCRRANDPAKGTLDLPGGFVDYNESAEQALKRELNEELGIRVETVKYEFSLPNDYLYSDLNIPTLDMFFVVQLPPNAHVAAHDDVAESFFVALDKLKPCDFGLDSIKKAVSNIIKEKR